jgi:hypothetical protein
MLATLLAWLYISFLCWTWGVLFLTLTRKITKTELVFPHFSIICITGLSIITILAGVFSLYIPLGHWWVQFFFILPALAVFFINNVPNFFSSLKKEFSFLRITALILLLLLLLLVLVMSSWVIVHPDTLGYHAQTMQWIEKYKAVPGLVHLHVRFGYQGLWFVDCALFDFSFAGKQGITFLNSTVLFWFLTFIVNRIDHNFFKDRKSLYGLLWLGLLSLSLWSYTQVRLTASSASPDFIATVIVLLIVYLLLKKDVKHLPVSEWLVVGTLSIVAVTIKLSVAPILLIALCAASIILIGRKYRAFILFIIICSLAFTSFVARNIITTGYVVFPQTAIDIVDVDWKYDAQRTVQEKNYITAYAKKQGVITKEEIDQVNQMTVAEWLPGWWTNRSFADKAIFILLMLALIAAIIFIKKIIHSGIIQLLVLCTMLAGIVFWFINAPDPRFGFGFILGFICTVAYIILKVKELTISRNVLSAILIIFCLGTSTYIFYRINNFFRSGQLIAPLGIPAAAYKSIECNGIKINAPTHAEFGITPVPCTDLPCEHFFPRGNKIDDGFRAK